MKLAQLRHKHSLHQVSPASSPVQADATPDHSPCIKLQCGDDGSMKLTPRTYGPPAPVEPTMSAMPKGVADQPSEHDLDDFSKAAIKAMTSKVETKKVKAAAKAQAKRAANSEAKFADAAWKRPASVGTPASSDKAMKPTSVPASSDEAKKPAPAAKAKGGALHVKKAPAIATTKAAAIKGMTTTLPSDGSNPAPVHYKTGVIYTSRKQGCFRSLRVRGDNWTGVSATWGKDKIHRRQLGRKQYLRLILSSRPICSSIHRGCTWPGMAAYNM